MLDPRSDHLARAFSGLKGLESSLNLAPAGSHLEESFAVEYERAIDHLAAAGFEVAEFRLPADAVFESQNQRRLGRRMVDGAHFWVFVTKALMYFELSQAVLKIIAEAQQDPATLIGFQASRRAPES